MKLAQIILPKFDNAHTPLVTQHAIVRGELLDRWGGYTMTEGFGGWRSDGKDIAEPVNIYSVAMERAAVVEFRQWAKGVCTLTRQQCVMIVTPNGDVEFIKGE